MNRSKSSLICFLFFGSLYSSYGQSSEIVKYWTSSIVQETSPYPTLDSRQEYETVLPEYAFLFNQNPTNPFSNVHYYPTNFSNRLQARINLGRIWEKPVATKVFKAKQTQFTVGVVENPRFVHISCNSCVVTYPEHNMNIDSTSQVWQTISVRRRGIALGLDKTYSTNKNRRFSGFIGLGLHTGFFINNTAKYNLTTWAGTSNFFYGNNWQRFQRTTYVANSYYAHLMIPIGVNWLLSKKSTSWFNRTSITLTKHGGIGFEKIPGIPLKTFTQDYLRFQINYRIGKSSVKADAPTYII